MIQHAQLTHFAGFDWAKDHHDVIVVDAAGTIIADFRIDHTSAGWQLWRGGGAVAGKRRCSLSG
ncbi:MAG: hypothetical protein U0984_06320 [Prosthecobacter sp.]|nr:hypothetical protein [Prosthecobacter sp.]